MRNAGIIRSGATAGLSNSAFAGIAVCTGGQAASGTLFQRAVKQAVGTSYD